MPLDYNSTPSSAAAADGASPGSGETLITTIATALAVLVVAAIAVLIGMS